MAAELVGTAYVAIRAITSQLGGDIKDGLNKGSKDAQKDTDKLGKDLGDGLGDGVGDGLEDRLDVEIPGAIRKSSKSKGTRDASDESGKSISRRIADAFHNDGSNLGERIGNSLGNTLQKIELPGGAFGFIALNALPVIGGLVQIVAALGATIVAQLGYIVTAAAGAGVAILGVGSAIVLGLLPAVLAFKAETPALEEFKEKAKELLGPFQEIGEAAQEGLLPGLLGSLEALQDLIPRFKEFGREMGYVIGNMAKLSAQALTSDKNLDAMGSTMADSITVWENISRGVVSIFSFLPKLIDLAMPSAIRFTDSIAKMFEGWNDFITAGYDDGTLTETFDTWYDRLETIGSILGDTLVALWNVFSVGADVTAPMFENLEGMAERWREWTGSLEGQNKLAEFFTVARDISREVFGIVSDIFTQIVAPLTGMNDPDNIINVLRTFREEWLPDLISITQTIARDSAPLIGQLMEQVGRFIDILANNPEMSSAVFTILGSSIVIFTKALEGLNTVLENDIGQKLFIFIAPFLFFGKVAAQIGILVPALKLLGGVLGALLGAISLPVALIVAAIAAVIGAFALLYFHFQPFRDLVDNIVDALSSISLDDVLALPGQIVDAFANFDWGSLPTIIGDALSLAWQALLDSARDFVYALPGLIRGLVQNIIRFVQDLPSKIGEIAANLYSAFVDWAVDVGPKLGYYLGLAIGTLLRWVVELPGKIIGYIPEIVGAFVSLGTGIINWAISVGPTILATILDIFTAIPGFVASALDGLITVIGTIIGSIPQVIWGILSTLGEFLKGIFEGAFPGAIEAITGFIGNIVTFFTELPGKILTALATIGSTIAGVFTGAWSAVQTAASTLFNNVVGFFEGLPAAIGTAIGSVASAIAGVFNAAWDAVGGVAEAVGDLFDDVVEFFTGLPGAIAEAIGDVAGELASAIGGAFKKAWNTAIDALPSISFGGYDIPGPGPNIPSFSLNLDFMKFAMGGIVDYPTFAMIGEAGAEAVIPLTNPIRALELMQMSGLDQLALSGGVTTNINSSRGAALHIEHATFNDPVTADIVAAKVRAAIRL